MVGYRNKIMFIVHHNFSANNLIWCVNLFRVVHVGSVRCRRLVPILLIEIQAKNIDKKKYFITDVIVNQLFFKKTGQYNFQGMSLCTEFTNSQG